MSLFHESQDHFTPEEAVIALLFLAVTADGSIAPEEEELVIAASNRMELLKNHGIPEFNQAVDKVRAAIDAAGRELTFRNALSAVPTQIAGTIYALCADIVYANASATPEENAYLRQLQETLNISDDLATKVIEVMLLKNSG